HGIWTHGSKEYSDELIRFDIEGTRFAVRRWHSGSAKQVDIMRDSPALTLAERESYFRALLNATSTAPPVDKAPQLANMMIEISRYFSGLSSTYQDNHAFTQTPYSWANDPLRACRKTFALYITTGTNFGTTTTSPLPAACSPLFYPNEAPYTTAGLAGTKVTDPFAINTCAPFNTDHHTTAGTPPRHNTQPEAGRP
ncbi:BTB/POZ domain-containing protein, partial [Candidatus Hakubella thermalkaliphila]